MTKAHSQYSVPDEVFEAALREATMDAILGPLKLAERLEVRLRSKFQTACWSYLPPHKVYIGRELFDKPCVRKDLLSTARKRYIQNHFHHERAHALFTERDLEAISKELKKAGIPFSLLNLFEDARIEERYRVEASYSFAWKDFEVYPVPKSPQQGFFALIFHEGEDESIQWGQMEEVQERVQEYYRRSLQAADTWALLPILKEWVEEFGVPPQEQNSCSDLQEGMKIKANPKLQELLDKESPSSGRESTENSVKVTGSKVARDEFGMAGPRVDRLRAKNLADKFKKLLGAKMQTEYSDLPSRKISTRNYLLDRPPFKHSVEVQRKSPSFYLEFDCSGSMRGEPLVEGKVLAAALCLLAEANMVSGNIVLSMVTSGVARRKVIPISGESLSALDQFEANGESEGLESNLTSTLSLAKAADYVFVYTDAQIGDSAIDKKKLNRQGISTWGLYVGPDESSREKLTRYFDRSIIKPTTELLVDAMIMQSLRF